MKTYQYMSWAVCTAGMMLLGACSDTWGDHYENMEAMSADAPSLLKHVQADNDLRPFLRVVKHIGYDAVLDAPQALTLWAPVITDAQADSVIAVYEAQKLLTDDKGNLRKDKDNAAVTQFLQNHIALYGRSANSMSKDSVRMWNGKYMTMTAESLNDVPYLQKNIVSSNGIMYKLAWNEPFLPNVREAFSMTDGLDELSDFYTSLDRYELDATQSVQRDVVDGEIVYADSVINMSNALYPALGLIQREDSAYLCLAPTNEVWQKEYDRYLPMFNYLDRDVEKKDSIADLNARLAIIRGRFFNLHEQKNDYKDSIKNTVYRNMAGYYGLNVFQNPKDAYNPETSEGILNGLDVVTCSNGLLYKDNEGRIDPRLTFMQARYTKNYKVRNTDIGTSSEPNYVELASVVEKAVADSVEYGGQKYFFKMLKDKTFLEVKPGSSTDEDDGSIDFYLKNTLSNMYYNVYVVMVPEYADKTFNNFEKEMLPLRFQAYYLERLVTSRMDAGKTDDPDFPERGITLKNGSSSYFNYDGKDVAIFCLDKARKFNYSSFADDATEAPVTELYRIDSSVQKTQFKKGLQTNILRINRLIYIPFETEEEANAYQYDMNEMIQLINKEYKE